MIECLYMEDIFFQILPNIQISFARSSGPGGQNVNKRNTKAILHWSPVTSAISAHAKSHIVNYFQKEHPSLITNEGVIVLQSDKTRSQEQNRQDILDR